MAEELDAMQGARALLERTRVDLAEVSLQRAALSDADAKRLLVLGGYWCWAE